MKNKDFVEFTDIYLESKVTIVVSKIESYTKIKEGFIFNGAGWTPFSNYTTIKTSKRTYHVAEKYKKVKKLIENFKAKNDPPKKTIDSVPNMVTVKEYP